MSFMGHRPLFESISFWLGTLQNSLGQLASEDPALSTSYLAITCNYKTVPSGADFYMGSGDTNSWPHACREDTLLSEPSS